MGPATGRLLMQAEEMVFRGILGATQWWLILKPGGDALSGWIKGWNATSLETVMGQHKMQWKSLSGVLLNGQESGKPGHP
jgi:hypothetical protein